MAANKRNYKSKIYGPRRISKLVSLQKNIIKNNIPLITNTNINKTLVIEFTNEFGTNYITVDIYNRNWIIQYEGDTFLFETTLNNEDIMQVIRDIMWDNLYWVNNIKNDVVEYTTWSYYGTTD